MNSNFSRKVISVAVATAALAGCSQGSANAQTSATPVEAATHIDQDVICETKDLSPVDNCKPGQKIVFLPSTFGNEQLPVLFAAINCDLRYQVALTTGAVICIFRPSKPSTQQASASTGSAPGK